MRVMLATRITGGNWFEYGLLYDTQKQRSCHDRRASLFFIAQSNFRQLNIVSDPVHAQSLPGVALIVVLPRCQLSQDCPYAHSDESLSPDGIQANTKLNARGSEEYQPTHLASPRNNSLISQVYTDPTHDTSSPAAVDCAVHNLEYLPPLCKSSRCVPLSTITPCSRTRIRSASTIVDSRWAITNVVRF